MHNCEILTIAGTLKHVMDSAAEAEAGGLFANAQNESILRITLEGLGWK